MTTKILGNQITSYTIDTVQLSNTATAAFAKTLAPKVLYANVASNTFTVLDDTAVNVGGGYIVVTGAEFQSGATVLIDTTPASAVTYVNSTTLQVQVPTKSAASYNLYVVNPDGGVGIKVSGITYSSEPTWVTASPLANQNANTAFGVNLSATGATSYSVAAGSTLPAGTSLLANGYFSGTVTIETETIYTFSVVATDAELQDSSKTFQVTVTVTPATRLWSFGRNTNGQLGLNDINPRSSPVQIGTNTNWSKIANGGSSTHAVKTDGTLWAWGFNSYGQLGLNDTVYKSSPTQVGALTNWLNVFAGSYNVHVTKTDGTLWGIGQGAVLGINSSVFRSSPVQIGTDTNWNLVYKTNYTTMATKTNNTLWGWGINTYGELGRGNAVGLSSPTQLGFENWSVIGPGQDHFVIIKTDGTMWAAGRNFQGALGDNTTADKNTFVQVGSSTDWSKVNIGRGGLHSAAIKTNGTLWLWGNNVYGTLGLNNTTSVSTPSAVGSGTNWNNIYSSRWTVFATTTDGEVWSWGRNSYGNLGHNDVVFRSSPTQVGTSTNWTLISAASDHTTIITSN